MMARIRSIHPSRWHQQCRSAWGGERLEMLTRSKESGLLGGHRTLAWDLLMQREVFGDEVMFGELESLARVEC